MWRARTVGEALQDLNRFLHVQDRGSVTFVRPGADQPGGLRRQEFVVVHPGQRAAEVAFHAVFGPVVEFVQQRRAYGCGLKPERVAAEVQCGRSVVRRENEMIAEMPERILRIAGAGKVQGVFKNHDRCFKVRKNNKI